jgi:serine/threonine-protein kinase
MINQARVQELLEQALTSGATPEEVCAGDAELLTIVRARWEECRRLDERLGALFPSDPSLGQTHNVDSPPAFGGAYDPNGLPAIPQYEIEGILGRGGMGIVYRARDLVLRRHVALKMLLSGGFAGHVERARFLREARAVATLQHPHVVQVHEAGEHESRPYFTMELVEGGSLAQMLAGVPQPPDKAAELVESIAGAVEAAHRAGIIHRDLKPGNVLLTADGTPKVGDFGLAFQSGEGEELCLTRSGMRIGTPSYMAPEQASGRTSAIGPATDVYSLGAILYEMLTGRPPFRGETPVETERQVINDEPAPPSRLRARIPRDLETICLKCLEKDPARRYATASALAEDLGRFRRGEPITARPVGRIARAIKWARRRPATATALLTGAATALTLLGVTLWVVTDRAATARAVHADLDEAVRHQQSAAWVQANAALDRARLRLRTRGPEELRARLERVGRDAETVRRLEVIRASHAYNIGDVLAFTDADRAYEATFRQLGLADVETPTAVAGERVRQSPIRLALIDALYDWSVCRGKARNKWLLEVAESADPDPTGWRAKALADAVKTQQAVAALASDPSIDRQPVSLLLFAATAITRAKLDPLPVLLRTHRTHPDDFWVNLAMGDEMLRVQKHSDAVRYYQAAQAVRPDAALAHFSLGRALAAAGRPLDAVDPYQEALRRGGDSGRIRANLAVVLSMAGRHQEACREFEVALKQIPPLARYFGAYAYSLMGVGRHAEAVDWATRAAAGEPWLAVGDTPVHAVLLHAQRWDAILAAWRKGVDGEAGSRNENWRGYAEFALFCGDVDEYRRACREQLERFGEVDDPVVCEGIARACLLAEPPEDVLRGATALVDRILAGERRERTWRYPYFMLCQGTAELRAGRTDSALTILEGPAQGALEPARKLVTALAQARLGRARPALIDLTAGVLAFDWSPSQADSREAWMYHALRREAERAILPQLPRFLTGQYDPQDDLERVAMTAECQFRELHAARARLLKQVMGSTRELAVKFRKFAVTPAAMAGCGLGKDAPALNDSERERWRAQARQWVREELSAAAGGAQSEAPTARTTLAVFLATPELACVREPAGLLRLPAAERQEWTDLWEQARKLAPAPASRRNR